MAKRLAFAIVAGLSLGGCCHDGFGYSASHSSTLAQLRPIPIPHHLKREKPRNASNSTVTSEDIPLSEDELSKSADDELRKKLVICRGCEQPEPDRQANSIWPRSPADGHLTVDQVSRLFPAQSPLSGGQR